MDGQTDGQTDNIWQSTTVALNTFLKRAVKFRGMKQQLAEGKVQRCRASGRK